MPLPLARWHGPNKHRDNSYIVPLRCKERFSNSSSEMFARPGAPPREEMLTIQVKNTALHLNGQNARLTAKNGRNSKTPGLHLSATHAKEAAGHLTACSPTQEGTAQLDLLLLKSPKPDLEKEAENRPVRRPLKLAPLELPEEVKEAQREKLKFIQQEAKPASCKLDVIVNEPRVRKVKSCVRQRLDQQQNISSRPKLTRPDPTEHNGDRHVEDVVCRGTPAPLRSRPAPPLLSPRVKAQDAHNTEVAHQNSSTLQQETGKRRLRLRRAHCLEEDQYNSNTSTGGLSADKGKLAQGGQRKGQQAERALRGQSEKASKSLLQPPGSKDASARKSHQEDCSQQSARCTLNRQSAEGGGSEHALEGVKPRASNWRLKRKQPLIAKHNNAVPLECL